MWLREHSDDDPTSRKIRRIRDLQALGSEVIAASVDVANYEQMASLVLRVTQELGEIEGVVHAAGIAGGGMAEVKEKDAALAVLRPKLQGAMVLATTLESAPLEFFVACSSLTAVTGTFGQVDYCAANAFLDAFVQAKQ